MTKKPSVPSFIIARSVIHSLAPHEVEDIADHESALDPKRKHRPATDGLEFGTTGIIVAIAPIAYFIAGKVVDKLTGWAVEAALSPVKEYLTEKGRLLLSRWLQNPQNGEFAGGLTDQGKEALRNAVIDDCKGQNFDPTIVGKVVSKIEDSL